jgi:pyruvate decarboxylase
LVIDIGPVHSDSNTGGFTRNITDGHTIILAHNYCQVRGKKYEGVHFLPILKRIVEELEKDTVKYDVLKKQSWKKLEVSIYSPLFASF